jgi:integrase
MADWTHITPEMLLANHYERFARHTARSYRRAMILFCEYVEQGIDLGDGDMDDLAATRWLMDCGPHRAKYHLGRFAKWLHIEWGYAANTVRTRVASIQGLITVACDLQVVDWTARIKLPAPVPVRDTRGPDAGIVRALLTHVESVDRIRAWRDAAIIGLLFESAMRCDSVLSIDARSIDLNHRELQARRKGHWGQLFKYSMSRRTARNLRRWIEVSGVEKGPLFRSLGHRYITPPPLTYDDVNSSLKYWAKQAGLIGRFTPHGLRHSGTTELLSCTGGDVTLAMNYAGHRDPKTTMLYDDRRAASMSEAVEIVSRGLQTANAKRTIQQKRPTHDNS